MGKVESKRRRRVTRDIVLGRTLSAVDAEFAMQYTTDIAQRAPTVVLSAIAMLGLGLTQIHSLFPLTTATSLLLVFCLSCLFGGVFFSVVILRVWQWHRKRKTVALERDNEGLPNDFWGDPTR